MIILLDSVDQLSAVQSHRLEAQLAAARELVRARIEAEFPSGEAQVLMAVLGLDV